MSLRTQAWLCFAGAALAFLTTPYNSDTAHLVGGVAAFLGASLWLSDGKRRAARAARLAESDDEDEDDVG